MSVQDLECPFCGAKPGKPCTRPGGLGRPTPTHYSRFAEAIIEIVEATDADRIIVTREATSEQG